jgi:RimJ/RimL family protein N-acetyltransferase
MDVVRLHSGREVEIRPLGPQDGPALRAAYDHLSDETKYKRFMAVKPHLTGSDIRYLTSTDGDRHIAFVATPVGRPDQILGVVRCVRLREQPETAEFAITIGDPHQGDGLGSAMMERLAAEARRQGITRFIATMLADNVAAHKLTRRLAGEIAHEHHLGPVDELEVQLADALP